MTGELRGRERGRLLSTKEVGEVLGIKPYTVLRICERGELGHIRVGGPKRPTVMIPERDLDDYIEKRRTPPAAEAAPEPQQQAEPPVPATDRPRRRRA